MHNINGAANQLFLNWSTLQWCKNITKNHYDNKEFYKIFNPFPHVKILDQTKLEAFADKSNVMKMIISVFDRRENIVGKGESACSSTFSFSHNVFKMLLSQTR